MGIKISRKSLILLVFTLVALLLLFILLAIGSFFLPKAATTTFSGYKFAITSPIGWEKVGASQDLTTVRFRKGGASVVVNIYRNKILNNFPPPEAYANQFIEVMSEQSGFSTGELTQFKFKDAIPAAKTEYKIDDRQGVRLDLTTNQEYLDITFESAQVDYERLLPEFNQMLESLNIVVPAL